MVEVNSTHHQKEANPNVCSPIYLLWIIFCVFCLPQSLYMVKYEFQIHIIIVHCCIGPHYLSCPFSSAWSADVCEHSEISWDYISSDRRRRDRVMMGSLFLQHSSKHWELGCDSLSITTQSTSFIVLVEYTNIPFYTFSIRIEIAELAIASYN